MPLGVGGVCVVDWYRLVCAGGEYRGSLYFDIYPGLFVTRAVSMRRV